MSALVVCLLTDGDWGQAGRAVASAARFGLPLVAGLTSSDERGERPAGIPVHAIPWLDHFAMARNLLLDRVEADLVLWLDADEELEAFAMPDLAGRPEQAFGVWIEDHPDLTARPVARLHRKAPGVRWVGAVHELIATADEGDPPILDGILIRHHGYLDPALVAAKVERNHRIAVREAERGDTDYALVLEHARWLAFRGEASFTAWLEVFNHRDARPAAPGGIDRRIEAAEALCAMGYTTPAKLILAETPGIVPLRLALLAAEPDEAGIAALESDLAAGRIDPRYAMPKALAEPGAVRRRLAP